MKSCDTCRFYGEAVIRDLSNVPRDESKITVSICIESGPEKPRLSADMRTGFGRCADGVLWKKK